LPRLTAARALASAIGIHGKPAICFATKFDANMAAGDRIVLQSRAHDIGDGIIAILANTEAHVRTFDNLRP